MRPRPPTTAAKSGSHEPRIGSPRFEPIGLQESAALRLAGDSVECVVESEQIVPRPSEGQNPVAADALQIDQRQADFAVGAVRIRRFGQMQVSVRQTVPMQLGP